MQKITYLNQTVLNLEGLLQKQEVDILKTHHAEQQILIVAVTLGVSHGL